MANFWKELVMVVISTVSSSLVYGQMLTMEHHGKVYHDGDQLAFNMIGNNADSSLKCNTAKVNPICCRMRDGAAVGDWYFPDGRMVPRARESKRTAVLVRMGYTEEVRLLRRLPTHHNFVFGNFTCSVPGFDGVQVYNISILLYPTPCTPTFCDENANCTEGAGLLSTLYTCSCNPPYEGDGFTCTVPDLCLSDPCPLNATCNRNGTLGETYFCSCPPPLQWDGLNCFVVTNTTEAVMTTPTDTVMMNPEVTMDVMTVATIETASMETVTDFYVVVDSTSEEQGEVTTPTEEVTTPTDTVMTNPEVTMGVMTAATIETASTETVTDTDVVVDSTSEEQGEITTPTDPPTDTVMTTPTDTVTTTPTDTVMTPTPTVVPVMTTPTDSVMTTPTPTVMLVMTNPEVTMGVTTAATIETASTETVTDTDVVVDSTQDSTSEEQGEVTTPTEEVTTPTEEEETEEEETEEEESPFSPRPDSDAPVVLPLISEEERPEIVPRIPEDMPPEPRSISIVFAIVPEQGDVDRLQILVQRQLSFNTEITTYYRQRTFTSNYPQYVAMEINVKDDSGNTVKKRSYGDGKTIDVVIGVIMSCSSTDDPCNGPLEPNTEYAIRYRLYSGTDVVHYDFGVVEKTAPLPEDTSSIIVGVVLVLVMVVMVMALIIIIFLSILHRDRIIAQLAKRTRSVATYPAPALPPHFESEEKDMELDDEDYDDKVPDLQNTAI